MKLLVALILVLAAPAVALCITIIVPKQQPTIQAAINAAMNGDTVLVQPGTYVENIDFLGKTITVRSDQGPKVTVIDGGNPSDPNFCSVVIFQNGEGPGAVLQGFTLINGTGTFYPPKNNYYGGGVFCLGSSPTISGNHVTCNSAFSGGGIACWEQSHALVLNNTVYENTAANGAGGMLSWNSSTTISGNSVFDNTAYFAAGIYTGNASPGMPYASVISDNDIYSNATSTFGGGIYCSNPSSSWISKNRILQNSAEYGSAGIHVGGEADALIITDNLIAGNTALGHSGGGIGFWLSSGCVVTNNTIVGNSSTTSGGGLSCWMNSSAVVVNTILWDNDAPAGPEICIGSTLDSSVLSISYSDVEGGQASVLVDPLCTLDWGPGMINTDPLFVDPSIHDHHLTFPSPCRNSGDNASVPSGLLEDFEGDPRVAHGFVDMGMDEFNRHLYFTGNATPGGSVELKFVDLPGTSPVGFWIAFNVLETPLPGAYGDWYLLPPMLGPISLPPIPSNGVQSLSGALPAAPPGPYSLYLQAILGSPLKLTNLCTMHVQ